MSKFRKSILIIGILIAVIAASLGTALALYATGSIATDPIELVFSVSNAKKTYDGTPLKASSCRLTSGALNAGDRYEVEYLGEQTDVGVSASDIAVKIYDENDYNVSDRYIVKVQSGTLTVTKKSVTIEMPSQEVEYSDKEVLPVYNVTAGELVSGHKVYAPVDASVTEVGDLIPEDLEPVIYDKVGNEVSKNYEITSIVGEITVVPRKITVRPRSYSKTYDGEEIVCNEIEYVEGRLVNEQYAKYKINNGTTNTVINATLNGPMIMNITEFNVFKTLNGVETDVTHNYEITYETGTIDIARRDLKITAKSGEWIYDGLIHSFESDGEALSVEGLLDGDEIVSVKYTGSVQNVSDGVVANRIDCNLNVAKENYNVTYVYGTLKVTPREITVTTPSYDRYYNGQALTVTSDDLVGGLGADLAENHSLIFKPAGFIPSITDAGEISDEFECDVLDVGYETVTENYNIKYVYGSLKVKRVPVRVTLNTSAKLVFNGGIQRPDHSSMVIVHAIPVTDPEYSTYDLVLTHEDFSLVNVSTDELGAPKEIKDVDKYTYTVNFVEYIDGNATKYSWNYDLEVTNYGELEILPLPVSLSLTTLEKTFDNEPFDFSAYTIEQLVTVRANGDLIAATDFALVLDENEDYVNAGDYSYTVKIIEREGLKAKNFDVSAVAGTVRINKYKLSLRYSQNLEYTFTGKQIEIPLTDAVTIMGGAQSFIGYKDLKVVYAEESIKVRSDAYLFTVVVADEEYAENFAVTYLPASNPVGTFRITVLTVTVTLKDYTSANRAEFVYDGEKAVLDPADAIALSYASAGSGGVADVISSDDFEIIPSGEFRNATNGTPYTYRVRMTDSEYAKNFRITYNPYDKDYGEVEILRRAITVKLGDQTKEFDGTTLSSTPEAIILSITDTDTGNLYAGITAAEFAVEGYNVFNSGDGISTSVHDLPDLLIEHYTVKIGDFNMSQNYSLTVRNAAASDTDTNWVYSTNTLIKFIIEVTTATKNFVYTGGAHSCGEFVTDTKLNARNIITAIDKDDRGNSILPAVTNVADGEIINRFAVRITVSNIDSTDITRYFNLKYEYGKLTVSPAPITVTYVNADEVYYKASDYVYELSALVKLDCFEGLTSAASIELRDFSVSCSTAVSVNGLNQISVSKAGTHGVWVTFAPRTPKVASNYAVSYKDGKTQAEIKINKITLVVTFTDAAGKTFTGSSQYTPVSELLSVRTEPTEVNVSSAVTSLDNFDFAVKTVNTAAYAATVTGSGSNAQIAAKDAGEYLIAAEYRTPAYAENLNIVYEGGKDCARLTIAPQKVTVSLGGAAFTYFGEEVAYGINDLISGVTSDYGLMAADFNIIKIVAGREVDCGGSFGVQFAGEYPYTVRYNGSDAYNFEFAFDGASTANVTVKKIKCDVSVRDYNGEIETELTPDRNKNSALVSALAVFGMNPEGNSAEEARRAELRRLIVLDALEFDFYGATGINRYRSKTVADDNYVKVDHADRFEYCVGISDEVSDNVEISYRGGKQIGYITFATATVTVNYGSKELVYNGSAQEFDLAELLTVITRSEHASMTLTVDDFTVTTSAGLARNGNMLYATDAGEYTITARYVGSNAADYNIVYADGKTEGKLIIKRAPVTVTLNNIDGLTYDGNTTHEINYSSIISVDAGAVPASLMSVDKFAVTLPAGVSEINRSGERFAGVKLAGEYELQASYNETDPSLSSNFDVVFVGGVQTAKITVARAKVTIALKNKSLLYIGQEQTVDINDIFEIVSSELFVDYNTLGNFEFTLSNGATLVNGTSVGVTDAGDYTVAVRYNQAAAEVLGNTDFTFEDGKKLATVTVKPIEAVITVVNFDGSYSTSNSPEANTVRLDEIIRIDSTDIASADFDTQKKLYELIYNNLTFEWDDSNGIEYRYDDALNAADGAQRYFKISRAAKFNFTVMTVDEKNFAVRFKIDRYSGYVNFSSANVKLAFNDSALVYTSAEQRISLADLVTIICDFDAAQVTHPTLDWFDIEVTGGATVDNGAIVVTDVGAYTVKLAYNADKATSDRIAKSTYNFTFENGKESAVIEVTPLEVTVDVTGVNRVFDIDYAANNTVYTADVLSASYVLPSGADSYVVENAVYGNFEFDFGNSDKLVFDAAARTVEALRAGNYIFSAHAIDNKNFSVSFRYGRNTGTLAFAPIEVKVTLSDKELYYNGGEQYVATGEIISVECAASVTLGDFALTFDKVAVAAGTSQLTVKDAKIYAYSVAYAGTVAEENLNIVFVNGKVDGTVEVRAIEAVITVKDASQDYDLYNATANTKALNDLVEVELIGVDDAALLSLVYENIALDFGGTDKITYNAGTQTVEVSQAGTYAFGVYAADTKNFAISFKFDRSSGTVELKPVEVKVTVNDKELYYNGGEQYVSTGEMFTVECSAGINTESFTLTFDRVAYAANTAQVAVNQAKTYAFSLAYTGTVDKENLNVVFENGKTSGTVEVKAIDVVVTVKDYVGKIDVTSANTVSVSDLIEVEIIGITDDAVADAARELVLQSLEYGFNSTDIQINGGEITVNKAGRYEYSVGLANAASFNVSFKYNRTAGVIELKPVEITITILSPDRLTFAGTTQTVEYGMLVDVSRDDGQPIDATDLIFTVDNGGALMGNGIEVLNAGSYVYTATFADGDNYSVVYNGGKTNGTITVVPATVNITLNSPSKDYSATEAVTFNIDELLNLDAYLTGGDFKLVSAYANADGNALETEHAGEYTYRVRYVGAEAYNYEFAYTNGDSAQVTVNKLTVNVTLNDAETKYRKDGAKVLVSDLYTVDVVPDPDFVSGFSIVCLTSGMSKTTENGLDYIAVSAVGSFGFSLSFNGDYPDYQIGYPNGNGATIVVGRSAATVVLNNLNGLGLVYDGTKKTLDAVDVATIEPDAANDPESDATADMFNVVYVTDMINAGTQTVTVELKAEYAGLYDVSFAGDTTADFEIGKLGVTVTLKSFEYTYNKTAVIIDPVTAIESIKLTDNPDADCELLSKYSFSASYEEEMVKVKTDDAGNVIPYNYSVEITDAVNAKNFDLTVAVGNVTINRYKVYLTLSNITAHKAFYYDVVGAVGVSSTTPIPAGDSFQIVLAEAIEYVTNSSIYLDTVHIDWSDCEEGTADCYEFANVPNVTYIYADGSTENLTGIVVDTSDEAAIIASRVAKASIIIV